MPVIKEMTEDYWLVIYTMEDIDLNSLRSYRIEFEQRNPDHIWREGAVMMLLLSLRLIHQTLF